MLKPLGSRLIIEFETEDDEQMTEGGILVHSDSSMEDPTQWAKVVAVGPGTFSPATAEMVPVQASIDSRILVPRGAGTRLPGGQSLIDEKSIYAIDC